MWLPGDSGGEQRDEGTCGKKTISLCNHIKNGIFWTKPVEYHKIERRKLG